MSLNRWASARRGGMTVLGKVVVPKPINLPSQRLENHGLDPNVEIVPKGTLSWGSKSSVSNAWGSSTLSPTDGGSGSPSRLSGQPSSGSGTRPSTAGSERTQEPVSSAWGSNSRPSSASGPLSSNQASVMSLRPRSAEPRPGSSHLSRFAEPLAENSMAWGPGGGAEKLGVSTNKTDDFSLSSGDFPSLGSEKDNSGKNTESQGCPFSSGGVAPAKERAGTSPVGNTDVAGATDNWRRDGSAYSEDAGRPSREKWHGDLPQYPSAGMPPHHFDPWHGAPINSPPDGVWYRGPPGGPYGAPVGPGGFPMEPFHYFRPPMQAAAFPNSQPVPPSGTGPRGPHPKGGDMYRPHVPDAYIRPGMPMRPGFYPGPMAYEGYYGPPMGYCNPNDRDMPFMPMAAGPAVFNRFPSPNPHDPVAPPARPGGFVTTGKGLGPEQMESGPHHDSHASYKVLLKQQHASSDRKDEKWESRESMNPTYPEKMDQLKTPLHDSDWDADHRKDEEMGSKRTSMREGSPAETLVNQGGSSASNWTNLAEGVGNAKLVDVSLEKKSKDRASGFSEGLQQSQITSKDSSLFQKIEGLNAKARTSDVRNDISSVSSREAEKKRSQADSKGSQLSNEFAAGATRYEGSDVSGTVIPFTHNEGVSFGDKSIESTTGSVASMSRRDSHGVQGRSDHCGKGKFNPQENDGWHKRSPAGDSGTEASAIKFHASLNTDVHDHSSSLESIEQPGSALQGSDEGDSAALMPDNDGQAQRAKMRELAKQRARQLQKEEEERTREQKARALAKLEELNRRAQACEGSSQKVENDQPCGIKQQKQAESYSHAKHSVPVRKHEEQSSATAASSSVVVHVESSTSGPGGSINLPQGKPLEAPWNDPEEPNVMQSQSASVQQDPNNVNLSEHRSVPRTRESSVPKQRQVSYKQKHSVPVEKKSTEKSVSTASVEERKTLADGVVTSITFGDIASHEIPMSTELKLNSNPDIVAEPTVHQRRKNTRSGKNKHKAEEVSAGVTLPLEVQEETKNGKDSVESAKPKASETPSDQTSVQTQNNSKDTSQLSEQQSSLAGEEVHGRGSNQWKSQHSRRVQRTVQPNRPLEKFHGGDNVVWAPVRSQNKNESSDEASSKAVVETTNTHKIDHVVQSGQKNKRAEMERYVPKPVAKELAQQVSSQQHSSLVNQTASGGTTCQAPQSIEKSQPVNSGVGKVGSAEEQRNGDGKQYKHGKVHGSWRQRPSTESARVQGLDDGPLFGSNPGSDVQKSFDHYQQKAEVNPVQGHSKHYDEWNTSDGWNDTDNSTSTVAAALPVARDHAHSGRGKRHPYKGRKGSGHHHHDLEHKNLNNEDVLPDKIDNQSSALETSQASRFEGSKENRTVERLTSQWQPKSQAYPGHNQRGVQPSGGQNVDADAVKDLKKDSIPQTGVHNPSNHDREMDESHDQSMDGAKVADAPVARHRESKRERKVFAFKGRPHSPNQGPASLVEPVISTADTQNEHRPAASGFRRNGNQNGRFGRGHETQHGDWSPPGQDDKHWNPPANRERNRGNSHYEYQPVGPHNNTKSANFEGQRDSSHSSGARFGDRGPSYSRRGGGNFYGRQNTARADTGYNGE
ncbi:BAT2, N-terminal [Dillenia turbinata]|uniref:BAT2, N-terminal n=1 Tax=Dillenia turbinata TaxID=194707 RepID=A0AAN8Z158_9MAGN